MSKSIFATALLVSLSAATHFVGAWPEGKESDKFQTSKGELEIVFLGHSSLIFALNGAYTYVDPVSQYANYENFPKADLILITHEHADHLDPKAIAALSTPKTRVVLAPGPQHKFGKGEVLEHGKSIEAAGLVVSAVPAYNVTPERLGYHPKERKDNGYVIEAGSTRIYVAGDTEPIPEMASLGNIDIAFLPMNLPFTMTPSQVAAAARTIRPKILYPYHFGSTNPKELVDLLKDEKDIEVRLRKLN